MNFQAARNNPGNFVQMQGTAVKFDIKSGEFGNYALGNMVDNTGMNEKVFYATSDESPLPDISVKNQLATWGIVFDANKQRFKAYFNGYVQQQAQGHQGNSQQGQITPYQPPQAAQSPPQQPNAPQGGNIAQIAERIAVALEKIAAKDQSFEQKYNLNEGDSPEGDCPI